MSQKIHYRNSALWGFAGIVFGICAFLFNYYLVPLSLPGYQIIAAPAMFTLSFFSEETYFIPKMILYLSGQFIGYFLMSCFFQFVKLNVQELFSKFKTQDK